MKIDEMWDFIIDNEIATEAELQLVTDINGYNKDSINDVLYARTGYRSVEQYKEAAGVDEYEEEE